MLKIILHIVQKDVYKRQPPYPVFDNEKYVALAYKYHLIDEKYELKILNECVCIVDYQDVYKRQGRNAVIFL